MPRMNRPPGFDFAFGGVNLRTTPDALQPTEYACAQNIRANSDKSIRTRPGYIMADSGASGHPITDIRAYSLLGTDNIPRFLTRDSINRIIVDIGAVIATLSGLAGSGVCMIPFRPNQSPQSWMYICGLGDYRKFAAPNPSVLAQKVGIAEPQSACDFAPQAPLFTNFSAAATNWTNSGTAVALGDFAAPATTAAIFQDPVIPSRYSVQVGSGIFYQIGQLLTFIGSASYTVIVQDVMPSIPTMKIQAIQYFSGSTGRCFIVPYQSPLEDDPQFPVLRRGALIELKSTEVVMVLSCTVGTDGSSCIETSTAGTYAVGDSIVGVAAVIVDGIDSSVVGNTVNLNSIGYTILAGTGLIAQSLSTNPFNSKFGTTGIFPQREDYLHLSFYISDATKISSIIVTFAVNAAVDYAGDSYYYSIPLIDLSPGLNQWSEILIAISDLQFQVSNETNTLINCTGVQIAVVATGSITFDCGSLWVGGSGQPDVGDQGAEYRYRLVPRSSLTGATGNATPDPRYGVTPRRQPVTVVLPNPTYDSQIDTWDVYRYGGTVDSWQYLGSARAGDGTFTDDYFDTAVEATATMQTDNFEPWPSIDQPYTIAASGTVGISVVGTWVTISNASPIFPGLVTRWMPGTLIQIAGLGAFTLRSRPVLPFYTTCVFELEECAGAYSPTSITVAEPKVARAMVPYMWGPNEQGNIFAVGDPLRPGRLYWCKPNNPDSAPDTQNMELCPPSEPLIGGEVIGGISLVSSTKRWWAMYPSFSYQAQLTGAAQGQQYTPIEQAVGRSMISPYGHCTDGQSIFFYAKDCIGMTGGGPFKSLTDAQLYDLFPHEGVSGQNITRNGVTFYAPDYSRAAAFRLSREANYLKAHYKDSSGTYRTLVCDLRTGGWSSDAYHDQITVSYAVEQQAGTLLGGPTLYPEVVMGDTLGHLWQQQDNHNDNGIPIACTLATFEWDGGDKRADALWNDVMLNATPVSGISVTPVSYGSTVVPTVLIPASSTRGRFFVNVASPAKFMGILLTWTDNFLTQSGPTSVNFWQPLFESLPIQLNIWSPEGTGFGLEGYKTIYRILAAYRSTSPVVLTIRAYDGTSPEVIALPSTNGQYRKTMFTLTANKGMLFFFSALGGLAWQPYFDEWEIHVGQWGRSGPCTVIKDLPKLMGAG